MRRPALVLLILAIAFCLPVMAQEAEGGHKEAESSSEGGHGNMEMWKWANFLLLAGALGYLVGKNAGPFFTARSKQIHKDMAEALHLQKEAEQRVASVDARLANLESEIAALRQEARLQEDAEAERMRQQTAADMAKIQLQAEQEIAAAGKASRMELRRYAADLAVALAEQKIRGRMNPETQGALVDGFLHDLNQPSEPAKTS